MATQETDELAHVEWMTGEIRPDPAADWHLHEVRTEVGVGPELADGILVQQDAGQPSRTVVTVAHISSGDSRQSATICLPNASIKRLCQRVLMLLEGEPE